MYLTELNGSILRGPTEGLTWRLTTEVDIVSAFIHVASDLEASPCYHGYEGDKAGVAHWPLHHVANWPLHHVGHLVAVVPLYIQHCMFIQAQLTNISRFIVLMHMHCSCCRGVY